MAALVSVLGEWGDGGHCAGAELAVLLFPQGSTWLCTAELPGLGPVIAP